jgi:hypothetical protein
MRPLPAASLPFMNYAARFRALESGALLFQAG